MDKILHPLRGSGSGGKGGGGSGGGAVEDPNSLRSKAVARIMDIISEGTIRGLVNGGKSIFLDDTALQDSTGNYNFSGASYTEKLGMPDQTSVSGYSTSESAVEVNIEVTAVDPVIRTYNSPLDAVRLIFSFPRLVKQDTTNGNLHGTSVNLQIHKRKVGTVDWTLAKNLVVTGKCTATYQTAVRVKLGDDSDWDIKVTRITPDSTSSALSNETWWTVTNTIIDGKFIYPNTAAVFWNIDSSQFGSSVPKRAYDAYGLIVKIPSNYNPDTRSYSGIWDGTFTTAWTDNPAWILYDLLIAKSYGLGDVFPEENIDRWSLYEIAQYCDELVPDGFGGFEPRYTFNYWFQSAENALEVIQTVASCFQGLVYWASGQVFFAADMPGDPIKLVTPANVRDGEFTYEGISASARHSVCAVTWFDPEDFCNQAVELIEDSVLVDELGWNVTSSTLVGCTSRGQAYRHGKWVLDSEYNSTETVSYEAAFDHLDVVPGNIISVADPNYAGIDFGGRILSFVNGEIPEITLDRPVNLEAGVTYTLDLTVADGSVVSRTVIYYNPGEYTTITLEGGTFTSEPIAGAMWIIVSSNLTARTFRVLAINESDAPYYSVTALLHDPTKYNRIEQGIQLDMPIYTKLTAAKPSVVNNLIAEERLYKDNGLIKTAVTLSWTPTGDTTQIRAYDIQYKTGDDNWISVLGTSAPSCEIDNISAGNYSFRVSAVGLTYLRSGWTQLDTTLFGVDEPPSDVQNLIIQVLGSSSTLVWDNIPDVDLDYYIVKWSASLVNPSWSSALAIVPRTYNASANVPTMPGTYLIKAVDICGNESTNAATVIPTAASVTGFNAVAAISDWPTWSGTKTNTEVVDNTLKLVMNVLETGFVSEGSYYFNATTDLGTVYTSRISALIDVGAENTEYLLRDWTSLAEVSSLSGADSSKWKISLVLRYTSDDPAGLDPVWSPWTELLIGDYTARAFQFGILLYSYQSNITPVIRDVTITVDMPERTLGENNVSVSASGTVITFDGAFAATPVVIPTGIDLVTGDTYVFLSGPTAEGYTIQFKNAAGTGVARTMNWVATGYGKIEL